MVFIGGRIRVSMGWALEVFRRGYTLKLAHKTQLYGLNFAELGLPYFFIFFILLKHYNE